MLHNSESLTATADYAPPLLVALANTCIEAGRAIESIRSSDIGLQYKSDNSPLTKADLAAELIIDQFLKRYNIPIISEEASPQHFRSEDFKNSAYFLVDPLDGTREFVAGRAHYTVNIALMMHAYPLIGIVYAPALKVLYLGLCLGDLGSRTQVPVVPDLSLGHAWKFSADSMLDGLSVSMLASESHRIQTRIGDPTRLHALVSASHLDHQTASWVAEHPVVERSDFGSSLKFCKLAEGFADVYPRFAPTMEWDTAAGQAVLEAAGGIVTDEVSQRFQYGKSNWRNQAFIAWANPLFATKRLVENNATCNGDIQTSNLPHHRQVYELIASLADKSP